MKIFVATLAVLSALLFVSGHSGSHQRQHCSFPKEFNRKSRSCVCLKDYSKGHCVGYEKFCEVRCCHCPFSKAPPFAHPITKRWSQSNCDFVCREKKPATGCVGGHWCKSQCRCVPDATTKPVVTSTTKASCTTTTTKKSPITTTITTTATTTTLKTTPTTPTTTTTTTLKTTPTTPTTTTTTTTQTTTTTTTPTTTSTTTTPTTTSTTTPTTTTTTMTTTTRAPTTPSAPDACPASFVSYDPSVDPKLPQMYGFAAGTYFDGSIVYAGFSRSAGNCGTQDIQPARLAVEKTASNNGAGSYLVCNSLEYNNKNASYLVANANLKWVSASDATLSSITNAVKVKGSVYTYYIGRVNLTSASGTYQQVSKVHVDFAASMWYNQQDGKVVSATTNYEVLVCDAPTTTTSTAATTTTTTPTTTSTTTPTTTTTTTPTTTTPAPRYPCALWKAYTGTAQIADGLFVGTSYENSSVYIGRGWTVQQPIQFTPGRLQTTPKAGKAAGVFVELNNSEQTTTMPEYLVAPPNCNCEWATAVPSVVSRVGLVTVPNAGSSYAIGLVNISNGHVAIAKVSSNFMMAYTGDGGVTVSSVYATAVLVCDSTIAGNVEPIVTSADGVCALWKAYTGNSDPSGNGFRAGMSWQNTTAYIGRGWTNSYFTPGRLQTTATAGKEAGVHVEFNYQERYAAPSEYLVVPKNCNCEWIQTPAALSRAGLVTAYSYLIGLVPLANNRVSIAKVDRTSLQISYTNEAGATITNAPAGKVLVCEDAAYQALTTTVAPVATPPPTACPMTTSSNLFPGQSMGLGSCIMSPNQCFKLILQTTGNLVLYRVRDGLAIWYSHNFNVPTNRTCMQTTGNLEMLDSAGGVIAFMSGRPASVTNTPQSVLSVLYNGNICIQHPDLQTPGWCSNSVSGC